MTIHKGMIAGLHGSWSSGLATLRFEDGSQVHCDNTPTVRAMDSCFGNVIGDAHTINNETGGHIGREIFYSTDSLGILEGFTPVEDAPPELIEAYEKGGTI